MNDSAISKMAEEPTAMGRPEEKRKSARNPYDRPVRFDLNLIGPGGLTNIEQEGVAFDISSHGLGLFTGYPLKKNDILRLHLPLDMANITLPVFAKVAWSQLEASRFKAGVQFLV